MLDALKEMHEVKFVHRDVKPDNFMVKNKVVKIIDFGISTQYFRQGAHIAH